MSILTKPLGKPKATKDEASAASGGEVVATKPTKSRAAAGPALATSPRANLLPPEIGQNHRRRAARRGMRLIVVAAVVLGAAAIGGAWYYSFTAHQDLVQAQNETTSLAQERTKYSEVSTTLKGISEGEAAQRVGGGTEVDWSAYLSKLQSTLPAGVVLTSSTIDSADSQVPYTQSTVPLENSRIATLSFTATSSTLPVIPDWIESLSSLPGFADASPNSVSASDDGVYTANITMHIDTKAFSGRFTSDTKEGDK